MRISIGNRSGLKLSVESCSHDQLMAIVAEMIGQGIDSIAALCRQKLNADPFSGHVFVVTNRRKISVKILSCDGQGFWLHMKFSQR